MAKRNWLAIARISDPYFRLSVSLTTDPKFLDELHSRWPELFLKGEDEGPLRIPLSALVAAAREEMAEDGVEWASENDHLVHMHLHLAGERHSHLDLPVAHRWDLGLGDSPDIPKLVIDQLQHMDPTKPMQVKYDGQNYLVIKLHSQLHEDGTLNVNGSHPEDRWVYLTPLECVDLDA